MVGDSGSSGGGGLREFLARKGVLPLLGGAAVVLAVVVLIVAVAASGGGGGTQPSAGGGGLITPTGEEPTPEATIDLTAPTVVATASPDAPLPGASSGDRIVIGKFGIDAPLSLKTVGVDGRMPNPNGPDDVAYYDFSNWPGKGGVPGAPNSNVVVSGHVDWGAQHGVGCKNNTVPAPCEAVFWDISDLRVGDEVELVVGGATHRYRITSNQSVEAASADWNRIVSATAGETITMITCGGDFDRATLSYNRRQVVTGTKI
jgi:LPXTG-site transpeptidase (sortase) family protein